MSWVHPSNLPLPPCLCLCPAAAGNREPDAGVPQPTPSCPPLCPAAHAAAVGRGQPRAGRPQQRHAGADRQPAAASHQPGPAFEAAHRLRPEAFMPAWLRRACLLGCGLHHVLGCVPRRAATRRHVTLRVCAASQLAAQHVGAHLPVSTCPCGRHCATGSTGHPRQCEVPEAAAPSLSLSLSLPLPLSLPPWPAATYILFLSVPLALLTWPRHSLTHSRRHATGRHVYHCVHTNTHHNTRADRLLLPGRLLASFARPSLLPSRSAISFPPPVRWQPGPSLESCYKLL